VGLKVASLLFACTAWYLMVYQAETIQNNFTAPIEFRNPPKNLIIETPTLEPAAVTLSGYQQAFNLLVPANLKFSIDLAGLDAGRHRIELDATRLRGNNGLSIERVDPSTITVTLRPAEKPATQ
jgi:YbbR domain-containing protein